MTSTAQATLRTAMTAAEHGIVSNGWLRRAESRADFWCQSAHLLPQNRIWESFRQRGRTVGTLFLQQSLGDPTVDVILSPAPIHKHSGGIIQDCYSQPPELYDRIRKELGRPFNLFRYWGPLASFKSTQWIAEATEYVMKTAAFAPDLLFTYLPHMDYVLQKRGPNGGREVNQALADIKAVLAELIRVADYTGYEVVLCSDYAIEEVGGAVFPNRLMAEAGLFRKRLVKGSEYPDLYASPALAVCDHQVAHIYLRDKSRGNSVRELFADARGVDAVLEHGDMAHPNAGDLIIVSKPGTWFAYPWWNDQTAAPDYASHVDIHNKIGFDPCELFLGSWLPPRISQNTDCVKGSHGRTDDSVFYATTLNWEKKPETFLEMTQLLRESLV